MNERKERREEKERGRGRVGGRIKEAMNDCVIFGQIGLFNC